MFYDAGGPMMAVDLAGTVAGREFRAGAPKQLFTGLQALRPHNYDLTPKGDRFLVNTNRDLTAAASPPIVVVLNWRAGLKQ
jgi:hypothetical protein